MKTIINSVIKEKISNKIYDLQTGDREKYLQPNLENIHLSSELKAQNLNLKKYSLVTFLLALEVLKGNLKPDHYQTSHSSSLKHTKKLYQTKKDKFDITLYAFISFLLIAIVGCINWFVDPLWYGNGNTVTKRNFAFNERITKTNLFLRTKHKNYDCLILGSSRAIALRTSQFSNNKCFNYALKGGEIEDFVQYAQFLQKEGLNPQKIYIGVDGLNFVQKTRLPLEPLDIKTVSTQSPYHAYLSADVLLFSLMTLLGVSPDPGNYYDRDFEPADFEHPPAYQPDFYQPLPPQQCDLSIVSMFADLRQFFPKAEFIGFVPPRSAWSIVNDTYGRDLIDCYLNAFYQLSQVYDAMYDFSLPSEVTTNLENTYDGSHFTVRVNNRIADILQGKLANFGVRVDQYSFQEYSTIYKDKIREFLEEHGELERWKG